MPPACKAKWHDRYERLARPKHFPERSRHHFVRGPPPRLFRSRGATDHREYRRPRSRPDATNFGLKTIPLTALRRAFPSVRHYNLAGERPLRAAAPLIFDIRKNFAKRQTNPGSSNSFALRSLRPSQDGHAIPSVLRPRRSDPFVSSLPALSMRFPRPARPAGRGAIPASAPTARSPP